MESGTKKYLDVNYIFSKIFLRIFTARAAMLTILILAVRPSVCQSVPVSHTCFVTKPDTLIPQSSFLTPAVVVGDAPSV